LRGTSLNMNAVIRIPFQGEPYANSEEVNFNYFGNSIQTSIQTIEYKRSKE